MRDHSSTFLQVAQHPPHNKIFQKVGNFWPHNTHENCANLLYDFCEEMKKQFPLGRYGLLTKDDGENGYTWPVSLIRTSHDVVAIPNGERVDCIGSAGDITLQPSVNSPWNPIPHDEWRPHNVWIEHTLVKEENEEVPEPPPSQSFPPYEAMGGDTAANAFGQVLFSDYKRAGQEANPGMSVWFWRTMYDAFYDVMVNGADPKEALPKSVSKHRKEWCDILGIPVR